MSRRWPTLALAAALGAGACQAATSGEMTGQTYRSLDARGDRLTADDVREAGGTDDAELARTFVEEGGGAEPSGASCLYARTTYRESYRGVARFCFDGATVVSVERNRADLDR